MAKVLIYSSNFIGKSMAGAAIRTWEFAKALSIDHKVVLLFPNHFVGKTELFECVSIQDSSYKNHFQDADILITQRLTFPLARLAVKHSLKIIIDAYDPSPLELLEFYKKESNKERYEKIASEIATLSFSFQMADGILCASEKQRDLWIGFLLSHNLITPFHYDQDPSLRDFIEVVPFGLSSICPKKNGPGLKEKLGLRMEDKILVWGGGIWNWLDPLSLIKAMKLISQCRSDIKLVFMGVKSPEPSFPAMSMALEAIQLSQKLGLSNQVVFFHQEWVPYEERQNFLLDADVGVSTHFNHLETQFSFRTRILDYIWAQLPILATTGDSFSELIERHHLGTVVPYQNEQSIADAILFLLNNPNKLLDIKHNLKIIRENFYWETVTTPLHKMIKRISHLSYNRKIWQNRMRLLCFLIAKIRYKGLFSSCKQAFKHISS